MRRALETWLQTTENDSKQLLKVVIDNISSVRTIHNINKAVFELGNFFEFRNFILKKIYRCSIFSLTENPLNWKQILKSLHLDSNMDFYHKFYQPLMMERIKTIITASWTTAVDQTEKNIREIFESNTLSLIGNIMFILSSTDIFY